MISDVPSASDDGAVNEVDVCVPIITSFKVTSYNIASTIECQLHVGLLFEVGVCVNGVGILGGVVSTITTPIP